MKEREKKVVSGREYGCLKVYIPVVNPFRVWPSESVCVGLLVVADPHQHQLCQSLLSLLFLLLILSISTGVYVEI